MSGERILLVEDEPAVSEVVSHHLRRAGFAVETAGDLEGAWPLVAGSDLVVLDRLLPDGSGLELLARLRRTGAAAQTPLPPVLLLTALGSEADRVEGLEAGADDYLVKPFSAAELVARVRALLRRAGPGEHLEAGDLKLDVRAASVTLAGEEVGLTRREFELLAFLLHHPGRVFSREELLDRVWGRDFLGTARTVDQHVAQLRARLGTAVVETVRGRGYRLGRPGSDL